MKQAFHTHQNLCHATVARLIFQHSFVHVDSYLIEFSIGYNNLTSAYILYLF